MIIQKNTPTPFDGILISTEDWEEVILPSLKIVNDLIDEFKKEQAVAKEFEELKKKNQKLAEVLV